MAPMVGTIHPINSIQTNPGTNPIKDPTNPTTNPREVWIGARRWNMSLKRKSEILLNLLIIKAKAPGGNSYKNQIKPNRAYLPSKSSSSV